MNRDLFWQLLEPVHQMAAGFCRKLTGDHDDGNDLYQDALLKAMHAFDHLKDHAAFRPWLYRIVINSYKNSRRQSWWRHRVALKPEMIEVAAPVDPADRYDSRRWLDRLLRILPAEDRALVVLHELQGWSVTDLAEMLDIPEGTIKTRLFRARRKMRRKIERCLPKPKTDHFAGEAAYAMQRSKTADH